MKRQDSVLLFILGLTIWILGTIYYAYRGPRVLETTNLRYWINFFVSPVASAVICVAISQIPSCASICVGFGHASAGHSRHDWRSHRSLASINVHAENPGFVGRTLRRFSVCRLCACVGHRGGGHFAGLHAVRGDSYV
jgi:hypothetical protein